ncbi:MAG: choice-of-anchor B family protein [Gemmatimonadetes bacterium]|nr:choice-of-anchor B family protein [Gemmatimonadota bacterium]
MRRYRAFLISAALFLIPAVPAAGQTIPGAALRGGVVGGFGTAVAIGDGEIFLSATGESLVLPLLPSRPGGIRVYRQDGAGDWTAVAQLEQSDGAPGDRFGQVLGVDGGTLVAGAPARADGLGGVYVFERARGGWIERAILRAGDGAAGDSLGGAVVVRGDWILVGASGHDGGAGAVYVYGRGSGGAWNQRGKIVADDVVAGDRFGLAVSFDGDRALIGAPGQAEGSGAAYMFHYDAAADAWVEEAKVQTDETDGGAFGARVSIDGDNALVAAPEAASSVGAVFVFGRDAAGVWTELRRLAPNDSTPQTLFGFSVHLNGDNAWIGAPGTSQLAGTTYLFASGGPDAWGAPRHIKPRNLPRSAFFGGSLAARGDFAVVGALGTDFGSGTGYVFERDEGNDRWSARATIVDELVSLPAITGEQVNCEDGSAGLFTCSEVDILSFLPTSAVGAGRGIAVSDLWGWTDPDTGKEYALVGRFDGTSFVDVSDPFNPVYLGNLPLTEGAIPNLWRDIKVYQNHAFIVSDGAGPHGIQIFDLTRLRSVANAPATFTETAHYDRMASAHNIVINEETGFAYTVGNSAGGETCGGGFHMVNIQDPTNPTFAGCFSDPSTGHASTGYNHDAQCVTYHGPDTEHTGKEVCFGSAETALSIVDVTDKANPIPLAAASYPNVGYAHQGWVSDDHAYFYMNDELDEIAGTVSRTRTLVWDIADLDDPILVNQHMGETKASDHNLYIRDNLMYQSNYVSGLRILDISDPVNPVEVAHFDTVPLGDDVPGFAGTWSNYPYFESGIIVVTSMYEGLFILKRRDTRIIF